MILLVADEPLDIGNPVDDRGRVVRMGGQGNQMRLLFCVAIDRPLFRLAMPLDVGDVGQPPGGDVVEMRQVAKSPAV